MSDTLSLKVWRAHPEGCRIVPADKKLNNTANSDAVKWCGPYNYANSAGWWLYPPVDLDIIWRGEKYFEYKLFGDYSDEDYHLLRRLIKPEDNLDVDKWSQKGGRTKFTWGAVEPGVVQIWTGLIFQTPPGWSLNIRSPINFTPQTFYVQEGMIETDWLQYDIWINLKFYKKSKWVSLRKESTIPLAQLVPTPRESYGSWDLKQENINRNTPEAETVFQYWTSYNQKKFACGGNQRLSASDPNITKDATTYHRERRVALEQFPHPSQPEIIPELDEGQINIKHTVRTDCPRQRLILGPKDSV